MDIGRALTFFTEDERWIEKTAIGTGVILVSTLLSFVLVGMLGFVIVLGYIVRLLQNVRDDVQPVLPEWDQWGDDFVRGLKLFVVQIVWALPLILITLPLFIIGSIAASSGPDGEAFASILILCASCLVFVLAIGYSLMQPGFTIFFARNEEIGQGLRVSEIWNWTLEHIGDVVIVTVVYWVGSIILILVGSLVGAILCLVGLIVTVPLAQLAVYYLQGHLYGQLAQDTGGSSGGSAGNAGRSDFGETPDIPPVGEPPEAPDSPQPPQLIS